MPTRRPNYWKRCVTKARLEALNSLAACIRGEIPIAIDWLATIAVANESMTTTNLAASVLNAGSDPDLPEDAKNFLTEVLGRNGKRNQLLLAQMSESIQALNAVGIVPILFKGSAILAAQPTIENAWRMVSDVDLLVEEDELPLATRSLKSIGYTLFDEEGGPATAVTLARPSDVGMLDIHTKTRGPAALRADDALQNTRLSVTVGSAMAFLPSPTFQFLHFVLHDQFHGRDFWRGSLDLRHLCDMARIASRHEIDWAFLESLFASRAAAAMLSSQMIQLNRLLGVKVPEIFLSNLTGRLQYRRILAQMEYPFLRGPFTVVAVLAGWKHRGQDTLKYHVGFRRRFVGKLRGARRLFAARPLGKL
jgi:hypothetical protein